MMADIIIDMKEKTFMDKNNLVEQVEFKGDFKFYITLKKPEKEDVESFFNDPENIEAIKEWDVCVADGLET